MELLTFYLIFPTNTTEESMEKFVKEAAHRRVDYREIDGEYVIKSDRAEELDRPNYHGYKVTILSK